MQNNYADIVIIGGGVIGASVAYFLSKQGANPFLLEEENIARGASGKAGGILTPFTPAETPELKDLLTRSLVLHQELAEQLDGKNRYDYRKYEALTVASNQDDAIKLREERLTTETEWLENNEIQAMHGWVNRETHGGVRFINHQLNPEAFTKKLMMETVDRGGAFDFLEVTGLLINKNKVEGVKTKDGTIFTEKVVLATGPWIQKPEKWLDIKIPIFPLKGEILRMQVPNPPANGFSDLRGNYVLTKPNGLVFVGTTEDAVGFNIRTTHNAKERILKSISHYTSHLKDAVLVEQTACLRPVSRDNLPIIGEVTNIKGVYIATGHGRKGIALSLATGEAISELITTGESSLDLNDFRINRSFKVK